MGAGLAIPDFPLAMGRIVPPIESIYVAVNFAHRCGALVVAIFVVWTVARVRRFYGDEPMLLRPAVTLIALFAIQVALGAITVWTLKAVFPTTVHVAVGAGVLAISLVLTLRSYRLLAEPALCMARKNGRFSLRIAAGSSAR
jgi:cytochrome c oxidase assembly protein subunit 15